MNRGGKPPRPLRGFLKYTLDHDKMQAINIIALIISVVALVLAIKALHKSGRK